MKRTLFIAILLVMLVSTACNGEPATQPAVEPAETPYPGPEPIEIQQPEPYPGIEQPVEPAYPGPENPGEQPPMYTPGDPTGYEPQPEDLQFERGEVFLKLEDSGIIVMESYPVQAVLTLHGDLPDPCHKLRVAVSPPDSDKIVQVEVYTIRDPNAICTAVLETFEARIPLGSFAGGTFKVLVNGTEVGTIQG